ncbi:MAG: copper resistance protein CopC [Nitriliruptor sp.]
MTPRPLFLVLLGALAVLLVAPAVPASAHAVLTGAVPGDGEALEVSPDEVRLTFNEPVVTNDGALRVFDADATRIDEGLVEPGDGTEVAVDLPELPDGAYVAVYRVVSSDSHPINGTITFTVGAGEALDADAIAEIAGPSGGWLGTVGSLLRGLGYVGTLLAAGAVTFAAAVARGAADRRRAERVGRPAALLGVAAVVLHLPVQAAAVSGYSLFGAVTDVGVLGATVSSGFGQSSLARLVALLALAVPWFVPGGASGSADAADGRDRSGRGTRRPLLWLGAAATLALGSFVLDGHQRSVEPTWLLVGGDVVHLGGAAAWFGGLVLLVVTLRAAREGDDPVAAALLVARFSRLAFWSVLALSLAGTAMSLPLVRGVDALVTTTYGWTLLAKVALVVVVLGLAAYNRRTLVPGVVARAVPAGGSVDAPPSAGATSGTRDAWARLTRTVQLEAGLLVLVLGLTGFLVTIQPAAEAAGLSGPATIDAPLTDDIDLSVTIDPSEVGPNAVHVYAFDATGQLTDELDPLRLEFTQTAEDIGPFVVEPFVAGPGHWTATIDDLRFVGTWEVRVVAGIGRFDEAETTLEFEVR